MAVAPAITPTYPGVYVQELESGVHAITGVATSITAFVGYTARGLDNRAKRILSFADFERYFGGLDADSELSYAVQQFFANGGNEAYVVRVPKDGAKAAILTALDAVGGAPSLSFTPLSAGPWAKSVLIDVSYDGIPDTDTKSFNLTFTNLQSGTVETFKGVTIDNTQSRFVETVVNDGDSGSKMLSVKAKSASRPAQTGTSGGDVDLLQFDTNSDNTIKITADLPTNPSTNLPAIADVEFTVLGKGEQVPSSVLGICRLFERKATAAIQKTVPGASIRCSPSSSGKGVRVSAFFPPDLVANALDTMVSFKAGSAVDADKALKLSTGTPNVAHLWLGTTRAAAAGAQAALVAGNDGTGLPTSVDLIGDPAQFTGIYALEKVDLFNILCIPDATRADPGNPSAIDSTVDPNAIFDAAMTYCEGRRAFLLIDAPPGVNDVDSAVDWKSTGLTVQGDHGAAYFPRLRLPDPLNNMTLRTFAPCGVVAGLYARIDAARGVWKAPAGTETHLSGVQKLVYKLTDAENGVLNPLGLNCFRAFPVYGIVSWGARTLAGADEEASEWKYVPVRRFALYLEETLYRDLKWVVFEPNDEPLWAQIRLNVGAFMHDLFRKGAFQGTTPKDAYFVKCDSETTTQTDIDHGIVNILVGFAPLKPAEFVIIQIQQMAGQIQT